MNGCWVFGYREVIMFVVVQRTQSRVAANHAASYIALTYHT